MISGSGEHRGVISRCCSTISSRLLLLSLFHSSSVSYQSTVLLMSGVDDSISFPPLLLVMFDESDLMETFSAAQVPENLHITCYLPMTEGSAAIHRLLLMYFS